MKKVLNWFAEFIHQCIVVVGFSFLLGAVALAAVEGGQRKERQLLESVCKVNGKISINDNIYVCKVDEDVKEG
jgi:hypothetical protein